MYACVEPVQAVAALTRCFIVSIPTPVRTGLEIMRAATKNFRHGSRQCGSKNLWRGKMISSWTRACIRYVSWRWVRVGTRRYHFGRALGKLFISHSWVVPIQRQKVLATSAKYFILELGTIATSIGIDHPITTTLETFQFFRFSSSTRVR